jgi:phage shock protein C
MTDFANRTLERKRSGRIIAGVCAGLAAYLGVDANVIRLAFALATILGFVGVLAYLVAWAVIPEEGERASIVEQLVNKTQGR